MEDGRVDLAAAAQSLYGGRGLDDYDGTPPEQDSHPSPFGKGTEEILGQQPQRQTQQGGQPPRGAESPYAAGQKAPEYDYGSLEASGADPADVDVFKGATEGLNGAQTEKLVEAHRQVSENFWAKQESQGFTELQEEYGRDLDSVATEVNGVLRQFDPENELSGMLKTYRMQANPAIFRFMHRVAGHVARGGSRYGRR